MNQPGFFITFEGGEGSGKTTLINRLAQALTEAGRKTLTTREPGGTPEGESIRALLVQRDGGNWNPLSECLLLLAARSMHVETVIRPALESGKIVICDRFSDSTLAYQGYGHKYSLEKIKQLSDVVLDGFEPDLTLILDIDPAEGLARSGRRLAAEALDVRQTEDRFENLDIEFHNRLRQGYLDIADQNPERCLVFDASLPLDDVAAKIQSAALERIG